MTSLYLGLRYLFKKRLSYLAIVGVALSVGTLFVVMSVMRGFEKELRAVIRGYLSDIRVESPTREIAGMGDWQSVRARILEEIPQVEAVAPFIESQALLRVPQLDHTSTVMFRGMDPELEPDVSEFGSHYLKHSSLEALNRVYIDENEAETPAVFIGSEMARQLSLHHYIYEMIAEGLEGELREESLALMEEIRTETGWTEAVEKVEELTRLLAEAGHPRLAGLIQANRGRVLRDEVVLMTATEDLRRRLKKFVVAGVFHTGRYDYDSSVVLVSLESAKDFLDSRGHVSGVNLKLTDYSDAPAVQSQLAERGYVSNTWEDQQRSFLEAVQMERVLMAIVLSFVGVLAGFCIFAILITSVYEKRHDIGTMKAVGYTSRSIAAIFMVTGGAIGVVGALLGVAGGFGFISRINEIADRIEALTGWTPFPSDVYYFTEIPVDLSPLTPIIMGLGALFLSLAFSILPALKAARMDPVETLRWE